MSLIFMKANFKNFGQMNVHCEEDYISIYRTVAIVRKQTRKMQFLMDMAVRSVVL